MSKVVLVGSSIFQAWSSAGEMLPGCEVVNRAIGGTITSYWTENLLPVLQEERPDFLLMYCGSNDLNAEVTEGEIVGNLAQCRSLVQGELPDARYAYFGIMKAPQKEGKWELIDRINGAVTSQLPPEDLYVEPNDVLMKDGAPIGEFFVEDGLHLTVEAYAELEVYSGPRLLAWMGG